MAFNQVANFGHGYVVSVGQYGKNIAGIINLSLMGSVNASGVCLDPSGNIYITDVSAHIILKITQSGNISLVGGKAGSSGSNTDQTVSLGDSRFNSPRGICCDKNGDLYVCDTGNNQIRKISNNKISLVAGAANGASGTADGVGSAARFNKPYDIAIDLAGNLFVADTYNHSVRKIKGGVVSTFAGLTGTAGNAPVWAQMVTAHGILGNVARFTRPESIAVDSNGFLYVGDTGNFVIKRIDQGARVRIFSGDGTFGRTLGLAKTSKYQYLKYSDIDKSGDLFIVDYNEGGPSRVVRVNGEGKPGNVLDWNGALNGQYVVSVAINYANDLVVIQSEYNVLEFSSSSSNSSSSSSSSSESIGNTSSSESSGSSASSDSSSSTSSSESSETWANVSSSSSSSLSSSSSSSSSFGNSTSSSTSSSSSSSFGNSESSSSSSSSSFGNSTSSSPSSSSSGVACNDCTPLLKSQYNVTFNNGFDGAFLGINNQTKTLTWTYNEFYECFWFLGEAEMDYRLVWVPSGPPGEGYWELNIGALTDHNCVLLLSHGAGDFGCDPTFNLLVYDDCFDCTNVDSCAGSAGGTATISNV